MMGINNMAAKRILTICLSFILFINLSLSRPLVQNTFGQKEINGIFAIGADSTEIRQLEHVPENADKKERVEKESRTRIAYNFIFYAIYLYFKTINTYPSR
jgi:hypothetical protein